MDLNEQLLKMKEVSPIVVQEKRMKNTIAVCKEAYFRQEENRLLTYWEFLWSQLQYTRKRWWGLQGGLLFLVFQTVPNMHNNPYQIRSIGVIGCLFVVLMIPELWRNRETDSIQVEAACLYSLRQVYAARITLFGVVDMAMLTLFSLGLSNVGFTVMEVMSQFLLPATVTACICFWLLCGKQNWNETVTLAACLVWGAAWWLLVMNESIYSLIVPSVWMALFGLALAVLALAIRRTVCTTNRYWEVILA